MRQVDDVCAMEPPPPASGTVEVPTDVGDLLVHADDRVMTPLIARDGLWEPDEATWLRSVLRPGAAMLDCGANVGYFTLLGSAAVGSGGTVTAVEPEPRNLSLLRLNVWRHGCGNVTVVPAAASDRRGTLGLRLNENNRGDHQTFTEHTEDDVLVPCLPLDELFVDRPLDVVKIDTQGSDYLVLAGLRQTLSANPGAEVLVEFWLDSMIERNLSADDILNGFRAVGRDLCILRPGATLEAADDETIKAAAMASPPDHWVNLVLQPRR